MALNLIDISALIIKCDGSNFQLWKKYFWLVFEKRKVLVGFADANYTGDIETRKCRSKYILTIDGTPVSLLISKAKYITLLHDCKETVLKNRILWGILNKYILLI